MSLNRVVSDNPTEPVTRLGVYLSGEVDTERDVVFIPSQHFETSVVPGITWNSNVPGGVNTSPSFGN